MRKSQKIFDLFNHIGKAGFDDLHIFWKRVLQAGGEHRIEHDEYSLIIGATNEATEGLLELYENYLDSRVNL